jgi:hypothetical protein
MPSTPPKLTNANRTLLDIFSSAMAELVPHAVVDVRDDGFARADVQQYPSCRVTG